MFTIKHFSSYDNLSFEAAHSIYKKITTHILKKQSFTLGLATGNSPKKMYQELIKLLGDGRLDLNNLHTFNLDEYYPIKQSHPQSFYAQMMKEFWQPLHRANHSFNLNNAHILNGEATNVHEECRQYECLIAERGGIDLQVLGLGINGHIAFNEPGSTKDSRTRKITIAPESYTALQKTYDKVPKYGLTMGVGTIREAQEIVLIATGEGKKEVYKKLQTMTKPDSSLPASYLLEHPHTTILTDLNSE